MPKIRLSALATDIKGKAGGSVFSRNSGGLYFRNNPSGGGRKSPKWDAARARFSSLASSWKNLSNSQKLTWNSAVDNFNTTNAFGENRVPSGYELFMRLNAPLKNLGLPINETAPLPATMPSVADSVFMTPGRPLWTPFNGYTPFPFVSNAGSCDNTLDCQNLEVCIDGCCILDPDGGLVGNLDGIDVSLPLLWGGKFQLNTRDWKEIAEVTMIKLVGGFAEGQDTLVAYISKGDSGNYRLNVGYRIDSETSIFESKDFSLDENRTLDILFYATSDTDQFPIFLVNGNKVGLNSLTGSVITKTSDDFNVSPIINNDQLRTHTALQGFFLSNEAVLAKDLAMLNKGYFYYTPELLIDFGTSKKFFIQNIGTRDGWDLTTYPMASNKKLAFPQLATVNSPFVPFVTSDLLGSDVKVIFETTEMNAGGRIGNRTGYKRINVLAVDNVSDVNVGKEFADTWGVAIDNSTIRTKVSLLNTTTGQITDPIEISFGNFDEYPASMLSGECQVNSDCGPGEVCSFGECLPSSVVLSKYVDVIKSSQSAPKFKAGADLSKSAN